MTTKNVRATLVTITMGNDTTKTVVQNKEVANKLLYVTAVHHWNNRMGSELIPAKRASIISAFYTTKAGNSFSFTSCTKTENDYMSVQQSACDRTVERIYKARKKSKEQEATKESIVA